jgi:hypothetical protein
MLQCIDKIMKQDIKSMCIQDAAVEEFTRHSDAWMPRMVWTDSCRSWYKNHTKNGRYVIPRSTKTTLKSLQSRRVVVWHGLSLQQGIRKSPIRRLRLHLYQPSQPVQLPRHGPSMGRSQRGTRLLLHLARQAQGHDQEPSGAQEQP